MKRELSSTLNSSVISQKKIGLAEIEKDNIRSIHKNHTISKSEPKVKRNLIPRDYLKVAFAYVM